MVFILSLMLPFIHSRATVTGWLWPSWSSPVSVMGLDLRASGVTSDYTYPIKSNRNPSYGASIGVSSVLHESAGRHHQTNRNPSYGASIGVSSVPHETVGRHHLNSGAGAADSGRVGSAGRDDSQTRSSVAVVVGRGGAWRHGQAQRGERHHCGWARAQRRARRAARRARAACFADSHTL
eukprot:SAG31_NODE_1121_length_9797_cov_16.183749_6_plen_180_part_00